jgi:hypothetical protein
MRPAIPFAVHIRHRLVLAYAWPRELLEPMVPPGLEPDTYGAVGFVAVSLVSAEDVRPRPLPARVGGRADLIGYRVLVRRRDARGRTLHGFSSLRGDADGGPMVRLGCLLTGGRYRRADIRFEERPGILEIVGRTAGGLADVHVAADLTSRPAPLPYGSPFTSLHDARRFGGGAAGFHGEDAGEGITQASRPAREAQPIAVDVRELAFFDRAPFDLRAPTLAFALHDADVEYVWERERRASAVRRTVQRRPRTARRWSPRPGEVPTPS